MDPYKYRPSSAYNAPFYTTNGGAPVSNNISSLTIGERGPVLLEDYHLIEKVANFTRERIPERVVHARGISAKGFFEVTHDISNLTCADFLRAPGVQTPVIVRFSTVVHERASPETMRDIRGFAVKFYTREGNFDLVGNNTPVFFIRDGIQFPDVVHALKPNPKTNIQEYWRILDYMSHLPESLLTWCWMFDDVGIPQDYRHMEGFGVHTYTLIAKSGKVLFVKFHWKPTCGIKNLTDEEAKVVGGANHSHATKDLHDAIASGNYPEWKLFIQTMDPADEDKFDFDPLDVTKIWPEDILPLQPVGRLVLNRTIDNFFNETEQLAFNPGLVVPGIYYSDDKLLQCRIFAYGDTQRHRLGPNYLQLPVNAPKKKTKMSSQICRSASKAAKSLLSSAKNARFFSEGRAIGAAAAVSASGKIPLYASNFARSSGSGVASKSWITGLLALPAAAYMIQDQEVLAAEMERTFIAIKPDGVQRGLISEIISRFERKGFKLVGIKVIVPSKDFAQKHYHDLKERPFFNGLCDFLSSGPVIAMVWEGDGVIRYGRKLIGATDPQKSEPGTIRGDLAVTVGRNIIHGSDGPETAKDEISLWFKPQELVSYTSNSEKWLYGDN